jgi:glucose/arabinose dehydrogenase
MARGRSIAVVALLLLLGALAGCSSDEPVTPSATRATIVPDKSAPPTPADPSQTPAAPSPAGTVASVADVVTGLDVPWGLAFLPGGRAVVTLRDAAQLIVVDGSGAVTPVTGPGADQLGQIVRPSGEGGLLGVAVLDEHPTSVDLALYATAADDNRVLRGTLQGHVLGELTPIVTGIHKAGNHDGGRLAVGPDGYLYVTTGDASDRPSAQDPSSLNGKILRVTADGDPAPGNPFGTAVWSLGHRNVQGLGWSDDGRMFASEFGQDTWDELNVIQPGGNYGWPEVEGVGGGGGFVDPVATWAADDASPSGLAVTADAVYLAALKGQRLWRVPLTPDGIGTPVPLLMGEFGRLRAVGVAPDGSLWVLTNNTDGRGDPRAGDDRILRVTIG